MPAKAKPLLLPIQPPNDMTPEGWLSQSDSTPKILPTWPDSRRLAIVMVEKNVRQDPPQTEAYVVLSAEGLEHTFHRNYGNRLYFQVPKSILLRSKEICPDLTEESWH